jgi:hypothetical protein
MPRNHSRSVVLTTFVSTMILSFAYVSGMPGTRVPEVSAASAGDLHSDFNGDGYQDLAIGVPGESIGTLLGAGAVAVLYGSSSGLRTSSPADQFWHQNSPGVEDAAEDGSYPSISERFGASLAAGDFNNDGKDDLAIGVPGESVGTIEGAGAVHVLYGSSSGLRTSSPADQFWHQNSPSVLNEADAGDGFGSSVATGDLNGDGFSDLAIGVPGESIGSVEGAGAVTVIFGSPSGLRASASGTTPDDQFWHQGKPGVEDAEEFGDSFGWSLASGDFNNDGKEDLAVGVPFESIGAASGAGAVNVLYGSSSGLRTSSPADQFWHQNSPNIDNNVERSDSFGSDLSAGDFNNDGFDELAIGVPGEDTGHNNNGVVHVLYGSSSGLQTTSPADQFWHQNSPGVEDSPEYVDGFGGALAAGDFNNDGRMDLAIGARGESITGFSIEGAGAVNVLYGSSSGLQTTSPADQFWHQASPGVEDTPEADKDAFNDLFGAALATGDFNNDGFHDLAIGVPREGTPEPIDNQGAVQILYGSSSGLQASSPADQFWYQDSPGVEDAPESDDQFGGSLS